MNRIQITLIKEALEYEHLLTDWESEFINSLAERDESEELSDKQNKILNKIGSKVASTR